MAYVEGAIKSLLQEDGTISTLLGDGGVWVNAIPQNEKHPSIIIELTSEQTTVSKDGPTWPRYLEISIICWAEDIDVTKNVMSRVADVINGYDDRKDGVSMYVYKLNKDGLRVDIVGEEGLHGEGHEYRIIHKN